MKKWWRGEINVLSSSEQKTVIELIRTVIELYLNNMEAKRLDKKEKIVYTIRVTRYLLEHGFDFKRIIPDPFRKGYSNWVFESSPDLEKAIKDCLGSQGDC